MAAPKSGNPKPKQKKKKRRLSAGKLLIGAFVTAVLGVIVGIVGYLMIIMRGQTLFEQNKDKMLMSEASVVYDASGKEVTTLYKENREIVEFKDIPKLLGDAFIATEDRRYNEHNGVDVVAIGRALAKDVMHRSAVEGGSTITQQLAKNMFLTSDKTAFRKATEVSIALALENNMTKDQILTMYLNRIYFGKRAYGIKAASKTYFGVSDLSQLKIWQMATLAAIPKAPSTYNPLDNPEKSKERRAVVLKLMYDQGYITEQEKNEAAAVEYTPPAGAKEDYASYVDYVVKEARDVYKIEEEKLLRGGYSIYTTLNTDAQKIMEQTYESSEEKFFQKPAADGVKIQSAMAIVDHRTGGIAAMIGGRDYTTKGYNRAVMSTRQPGSSFKPIIDYGPALEQGKFNPYSMLQDELQSYNGYTPHNWDNTYRGQVNMFDALKHSMNQPAVWTLNQVTVKYAINFASKLGFNFDPQKDNNLAIALGGITNGASPLQMAQAYGAFANNGTMHTSHTIDKITDADGKEIAKFKDKPVKVMSPKTAYYITKLLETVVQPGGTGVVANLGNRPTAGKTGTTQLDIKGLEQYNRDTWFVGYTPEWSAAVWEGFDNTDSKHFVTAGGTTAYIFKEVMGKALAKAPVVPFQRPDGVPELGEAPKSVTDLKATYLKETRTVNLNWSAAGDGLTYQLFRKGSKESDFTKLLELKNATQANDIAITQGETYQYYLQTFNPETNAAGDKSNVVEVKIVDASPSPSGSPGVSGSPSPSGGKPSPGTSGVPLPGVPGLPGGSPTAPGTPGSSGSPGVQPSGPTPNPSGKPAASPSAATPKPAAASAKQG